MLHETTGELCEISADETLDNGAPIFFRARTGKLDNGDEQPKSLASLRVVGLKQGGTAMVRWSDDDYVTNSKCRPVDLGAENARLRRCGSFRRRSFELMHVGESAVQVAALELD